MDIAQELLNGNRLALTRAITAIENETAAAVEIMKKLYPHTGHAFVLGITGPPGAGKSTLTDRLARAYRNQGKTVGIIAIDPTSPFTGGAILGDRIRMNSLTLDEGVFIRSMGTRGSLGGLSHKTADAIKAMDAFGKAVIIVETVQCRASLYRNTSNIALYFHQRSFGALSGGRNGSDNTSGTASCHDHIVLPHRQNTLFELYCFHILFPPFKNG